MSLVGVICSWESCVASNVMEYDGVRVSYAYYSAFTVTLSSTSKLLVVIFFRSKFILEEPEKVLI